MSIYGNWISHIRLEFTTPVMFIFNIKLFPHLQLTLDLFDQPHLTYTMKKGEVVGVLGGIWM